VSQQATQISARVTDSQARSIFTQEAGSFTFQANQINFEGHVFGEDSTWAGSIETHENINVGKRVYIEYDSGQESGIYFGTPGESTQVYIRRSNVGNVEYRNEERLFIFDSDI